MCELRVITEILHAALPCYRPGDLPRKSPLGPCVSQRSDASQATPRPFDSGVGSGFCPHPMSLRGGRGPGRLEACAQTRKSPARRHRDPDSRFRSNRETGIPCFPIPAELESRGHWGIPDSRFWPNRESGIPSPIPGGNPRFPAKSGIGGTGIGIPGSALCHQLVSVCSQG